MQSGIQQIGAKAIIVKENKFLHLKRNSAVYKESLIDFVADYWEIP